MTNVVARVLFAFALLVGAGSDAYAQAVPDLDPRIAQLVSQVSQDRLTVILKTLETFGTRNTMSSVATASRPTTWCCVCRTSRAS